MRGGLPPGRTSLGAALRAGPAHLERGERGRQRSTSCSRARPRGAARGCSPPRSSIYGDLPGLPRSEEMPVSPVAPYAVSKLAAEHYCHVSTKGVTGSRRFRFATSTSSATVRTRCRTTARDPNSSPRCRRDVAGDLRRRRAVARLVSPTVGNVVSASLLGAEATARRASRSHVARRREHSLQTECSPSPKITGDRPACIAVDDLGITALYATAGLTVAGDVEVAKRNRSRAPYTFRAHRGRVGWLGGELFETAYGAPGLTGNLLAARQPRQVAIDRRRGGDTTRRTPWSRAASRTLSVPPTFTSLE